MSRLDVTVGVKNAAFRTGLEQMRSHARKFGSDIKGMFGSFGGSFAGMLGISAGVAGLTAMGKAAIDAGSKISDMATHLRMGTDELQALMYLARLAGTDIGALEMTLVKVQNAATDAAMGNKTLQEAFSRLGIDVRKFAQLSPEEKLTALGVAYKNAGESAVAYNDISSILGERAGPKVIEILNTLANEGFPAVMNAARKAGQVMNEETVAALDAAGDEIELFKNRITVELGNILVDFQSETGMKKLGAQLALQFASAGECLLTLLLKGLAYIGAYTVTVFEWAGKGLYDIILSAVEALIDVINEIPGVKIDTSGIQKQKSNEGFWDVASKHQATLDEGMARGDLDVTYASKFWKGEIAKYERRQEREKATDSTPKPKRKELPLPDNLADNKKTNEEAERLAEEIRRARERLARMDENDALSKMSADEKRTYLTDKREKVEREAVSADDSGDELTAINKRIEARDIQRQIDGIKDEDTEKYSDEDDSIDKKSKEPSVVVSSLQAIGGGGTIAGGVDPSLRESQRHTSLLERIATGIEDSKIKGVPWSLDE